ncbi:MAG: hypothetical protein Q7T60_17110 [Sphingopyxis sp.]|nr:hypothetical protein [Sphingopyxis sp.]
MKDFNLSASPAPPVPAPAPAGGEAVRQAARTLYNAWKDASELPLPVFNAAGKGHFFTALRLLSQTAPTPPAARSEPAAEMTCDEQFAEAKRLASDLGYMVVPDPVHADGDVHAPDFVLAMQPSLRALGFHAVPITAPEAPGAQEETL